MKCWEYKNNDTNGLNRLFLFQNWFQFSLLHLFIGNITQMKYLICLRNRKIVFKFFPIFSALSKKLEKIIYLEYQNRNVKPIIG